MEIINNIDLLSVGVATTVIGILGFVIFFNNRRSITNRTFLFFALTTIFYSIFNYLTYQQFNSPSLVLWLLRIAIFFVVWHTFGIFQLFFVFPKEKISFTPAYKLVLVPIVIITSILTLTPYVFSKIENFTVDGRIDTVTNGPAILLFGLTIIGLVGGAIYLLIKKTFGAVDVERKRFKFILTGALITFPLYLIFNFLLPAFFDNSRFVPLAAVFSFPLFALTAYSIIKYRFLNIKIITTEILAFFLLVATIFEILLAKSTFEIIFRSALFVVLFIFSILLIKSVRAEVEQRERLQILTEELAKANEELKKLDQLKSEFISIASHQLRAPLTVIKGFVSLFLEGTVKSEDGHGKDALQKIYISTEQLIKLVNDLLNLSRIEAGKIKYDFIKNDFAQVVQEVVSEFRPNAAKKGLELIFQNETVNLPPFIFDADKLREVVVNFTDNAIKYSKQGKVVVKLEKINDSQSAKIRFSVQDQGIGIKSEDLKRLFTKFIRAEEASQLDPNGMGLGLYFVKRVVEDHDGRAWAESEGSGKGSTFFVELPIREK